MKTKKIVILVILLVGLLVPWEVAFAACASDEVELSAPFTGKTCVKDFSDYVKTITEWAVTVITPLVVLMLMVGGWQLMMAAGNPDALKSAQKTIARALTGLIAIMVMWGLMELLLP